MLLLCHLLAAAANAQNYDVLQLPAKPSEQASQALVYSVSEFHGRLYAAGQSGHILFSEDNGSSWQQGVVPVSSSIVDIYFPTPEKGWAVGHEGIILHSADGGKTWEKQYDGLRYGQEGRAFYQELQQGEPDNDLYSGLAEEMDFSIGQGADKPFFKVFFADEQRGYAMGAYGMSVATSDGGKTWQHNMHRLENYSLYHVFDFAKTTEANKMLLCGEAGLLMVADINERKAMVLENSPWDGSFFSCSGVNDALIIGGLRGRIFQSTDMGQSWVEAKKPPSSAIVDTLALPDGRLLAAGIGGEILFSSDNGASFNYLPVKTGTRIYGIAASGNTLLVAGPLGLKQFTISQ
jgi:photosystem II stability/assembly factor-like uncharacterized protein